MIDPTSILISTPCHDGKVEAGYAGAVAACASAHLFGNIVFLNGISHVSLARNAIAQGFLRSNFKHLVCIDSDITFSERDFRILCDYPQRDGVTLPAADPTLDSEVTRGGDGLPLISCAEYARKVDDDSAVKLGLGFCRISREVFEKLDALTREDGSERVNRFFFQGGLCSDYFMSGAMSDGHWLGEDHGFFALCRQAGIIPRIERRTNLIHWGRKAYPYVPAHHGESYA